MSLFARNGTKYQATHDYTFRFDLSQLQRIHGVLTVDECLAKIKSNLTRIRELAVSSSWGSSVTRGQLQTANTELHALAQLTDGPRLLALTAQTGAILA